jgi:hypothetical protein
VEATKIKGVRDVVLPKVRSEDYLRVKNDDSKVRKGFETLR